MTDPVRDSADGIAVIAMAGRFPGANSVEAFWENIRNGVESITVFSKEELEENGVAREHFDRPGYVRAGTVIDDAEMFDPSFFGYNRREAQIMDPQQRLFLECCSELLERAGYNPEKYDGQIGVFAGVGLSTYFLQNVLPNSDVLAAVGAYQAMILNDKDFLTTHVSYRLNLQGPSMAVQTACSTSLVAAYEACCSLVDHRADLALAGGVSVTFPQRTGYLYQTGMILSPDGHCRTFDAKARGTVPGKGVGVVLLKRLDEALAEGDTILAVIKGWAANNDGARKVGFTAPSIEGQAEVLAEALAMADFDPATVGYVEAHGTATELGDPIEVRALNLAYGGANTSRSGFCALGSLKSNMGHLDAAAGVAGLIKTVLALQHRELPPSLHYEKPNPRIDFDNSPFFVNAELRPWMVSGGTPRRAGVSSFGIGGTNAHMVLEEAPAPRQTSASRPYQLLVVSAKSDAALEESTANLSSFLETQSDTPLPDVAYTLQVGRRRFEHRRMVVCSSHEDAVHALSEPDGRTVDRTDDARERPCVFMFTGQGAQYVNMGRELYERESVFRRYLSQCCELAAPHVGLDMRAILYPEVGQEDQATEQLRATRFTQPALFALEYALAQQWMAWGVHPEATIGHSIGEYVAACLAEVFPLESALRLVATRGQLMQSLPGGAMLAVPLPEEDVTALLDGTLSLAAVNAPSMVVVSGPEEETERLRTDLLTRGVECRRLHTSHAFHSPMMDPILEEFAREVEGVPRQVPVSKWMSNVTGTWITDEEAVDPAYWSRHLRETVRFADSARSLLADPSRVFLEVGPGNVLGSLVRLQAAGDRTRVIVASLPGPRDSESQERSLLSALGRLWLAGVDVDWRGFCADERRQRCTLPTYPFQRERCWLEPQPAAWTAPATKLSKSYNIDDWFYYPSWQRSMPFPAAANQVSGDKGTWLLFRDDSGIGSRLARELQRGGATVVQVVRGDEFGLVGDDTYRLNPARPEDYEALIAELVSLDRLPRHIVHLWSVTDEPPIRSPAAFDCHQDLGFYSILALGRAVRRQRVTSPIDLRIVGNHLHEVGRGDTLSPEKATVLGASVVISQEYANISCGTVDLQMLGNGDDETADLLLRELSATSRDPAVAYRDGLRWVQVFERYPSSSGEWSRLRPGGVYLITGGLGGVGLAFAERLAAQWNAKLALVGRTELPPREQWGELLDSKAADDRTSTRIRKVLELEQLGADVLLVQANVADKPQMERAIAETEETLGKIDGVIHAAGLVGGETFRPMDELRRSECEQQFVAKARALYVLEDVVPAHADFCLLTSSISSVLGGLGYGAYAAANCFMDAFAHQHNQHRNVPWITANWDSWTFTDGPAADQLAMSGSEGATTLERVLSVDSVARLIISTGDLRLRLAQWTGSGTKEERSTDPSVDDEGRAAAVADRTEVDSPRDDVERVIAKLWQDLLGVESIGQSDNFFELGGNSLLAVQVVSRLQEMFPVNLALRDIFDAPTISRLAEHIQTMQWIAEGREADADELGELEELEL